MSWCSFRLPCVAWTVLDRDGEMILSPAETQEQAERMAAHNVSGSLKNAEKLGFRVVPVEIRLLSNERGNEHA